MALASRSAMRAQQRCLAAAPMRAFGTSDGRPFPAIYSDTKVICQGFTGGQVRGAAVHSIALRPSTHAQTAAARPALHGRRRLSGWLVRSGAAVGGSWAAAARACRACPGAPLGAERRLLAPHPA